MDREKICKALPTEAPLEIEDAAYDDHLSDMGGHMTLYKRVSMTIAQDIKKTMCPQDWDEYYDNLKNRWVAECTCTACGDTWHTGWYGGPLKSIIVVEGDDGQTYPLLDEESASPGDIMALSSNDGFLCPICGTATTLTHTSKVRSGMTRRLLVMSVDNVGTYTTIFYWMVHRVIDVDGCDYRNVYPWIAYVIDEKGRLNKFRHTRKGWNYSKSRSDAFYTKYTSGDGDIYNFRHGGYVHKEVPSLIGFTGEKTGLGRYVRAGGQMPVLYMKTWYSKPNIENLVNAGFTKLISKKMERESDPYEIQNAELSGIDFSKSRPHEMLGMDKTSFKRILQAHPEGWNVEKFDAWKRYSSVGGSVNAWEFDMYWSSFTNYGVNTVTELRAAYPNIDFPQIDRYMRKQGLSRTEVRLLADTWKMTSVLYGRTELTHEEMWPKNLVEKHDALVKLNVAEMSKEGWLHYLAGFKMIRNKYGHLEWTDGDLCICLPQDNGDLIREGEILRHCVGTYGKSHISEEQVIFFVRRYRRPERSYYTLSMNMKNEPKRVQLHGYGNERHGAHKQYVHKIPQKVLDFCARWESEIVKPWHKEQQRKIRMHEGRKSA